MTSRTRLGAVRIVVMSVIFSGGRPRAADGADSGLGWAARAGPENKSRQPAAAPADSQPSTSRRSMIDLLSGVISMREGAPIDDRGGTIAAEANLTRWRPARVATARSIGRRSPDRSDGHSAPPSGGATPDSRMIPGWIGNTISRKVIPGMGGARMST